MTIDPRQGAPKSQVAAPVHPGMSKVSKSGPVTLGGDHSSALDSLTGRETVPGTYPPGVADGPALDKAPIARAGAAPLRAVPGHRSRFGEVGPGEPGEHVNNPARQFVPNDVGRAVIDEALGHAARYDNFNDGAADLHKAK